MSNKSDFNAAQNRKVYHPGITWKMIVIFALFVATAFFFFALKHPFAP